MAAFALLRAPGTQAPTYQKITGGETYAYPDLVSFVLDPNTSIGTAFAAALLVIPFLLFGVQALRTGSAARERRLAALSLAGATRAQLRQVAVLEGTRAALRGGILAGPVYLVLWLMTGRLLPHGQRILPVPDRAVLAAWGVLIIAVTLAGAAAAGAAAGPATVSPLGLTRRVPRRLGRVAAALPMLSMLVAVGCFVVVASGRYEVLGMFLVIASAVLAAITAGPWLIVLTGRLAIHRSVAVALAGRRLLADPRTPGRVVGVFFATGGVVAVVVLQSGAVAATLGRGQNFGDNVAVRVGLGAALGAGVLAMVVAAASLVAGAAEQVLDGRRGMAILVALAASPEFVVGVVRRQLMFTVLPAAVLGTTTGWAIMSAMMASELPPGMTALSLVIALVLSGVASAAAALAATALVRPVVREACTPANLRAA